MALALNTTIVLSCEAAEEESGPTIVHSTGVESYRVHPEVIRLLQESCSNNNLCDHEKGVQCTDPAAHLLSAFERAGFTVTSASTADSRKIWMLTKTSEAGKTDENNDDAADAGDENQEEVPEDE
jgi:hypothetical protein